MTFRRPRSAAATPGEGTSEKPSRSGTGFGRGKKALLNTESAVYEYAVSALSRRSKTVSLLRRQLRQRVEPGDAGTTFIESALTRLKEQGYLSDEKFAQGYAGARLTQSRLGPRRVAQELLQKGIQPELVQQEVAAAFAETDEVTQARAFLAKKRVRPPTDQKDAARIFRLLARAGFGGGTAVKVLRLLRAGPDAEVPADVLDAAAAAVDLD
jgi:regulatory protein